MLENGFFKEEHRKICQSELQQPLGVYETLYSICKMSCIYTCLWWLKSLFYEKLINSPFRNGKDGKKYFIAQVIMFVSLDRIFLCSVSWPATHNAAGLTSGDPFASAY